jgi:hypothetical protein
MHLSLRELSPTNVGSLTIDAVVEVWARPEQGPVVSGMPANASDCAPHVVLMLDRTPAVGASYAVGEGVQLFIQAQCGVDGHARSWRATGGEVALSQGAGGWTVHIRGARMQPSPGDNHGYGEFVADGCSSFPLVMLREETS